MSKPIRPATAEGYLQYYKVARQEILRQAKVPAPRARRDATVDELADRDVFSVDGGTTWYVCAVVLFGSVAVYLGDRRDDDAPTIRLDAERDAACLMSVRH